jgi:hypothetical protein
MTPTNKPPSKIRIVLMWLLMLGVILFWVVFFLWRERGHEPAGESAPSFVFSIVSLFIGGFFLVAGVAGYLITVYTGCFSFNYQQPVWESVKTKLFFANIIVVVALALGLGFLLSAFLSPVLILMGMDAGLANFLPVMLMVGGLQVVQLWVLIWAPVERRIIAKRLAARGITPAQLQMAALVGLSNPASGFTKRFAAVEEDMGAMWVGPEQLIYWGDNEGLCISREQLVQLERKMDKGSTTVLGGIAHIILHVQQPDGSVQQVRLHTEGLWTMGQKRRAMDALAEAISRWHSGSVAAAPPAGG